jgi:hypothetical protein
MSRPFQQFGSLRGELRLAPFYPQHGNTELILELRYGIAYGGLTNVKKLSGFRERAGLYNGMEHLPLFQRDVERSSTGE